MRDRNALFGLIASVALVACSAGDPNSLTGFSTRGHTPAGSSGGGGGSGETGDTSGDDGGADSSAVNPGPKQGPGTDGGGAKGGDAGSSGGGGGVDASAPPDAGPSDGFDPFQHHNLDVVNQYRATLGLTPLVLDAQLSTFAGAGSQQLSQDHSPHQHFIDAENAGTIWSSGFKSMAAENQGDPNGWTQLASDPTENELRQIDDIQKAMFDEGPGSGEAHGHYENMMNPKARRLGVGLLEVDGSLYLTNDFSD